MNAIEYYTTKFNWSDKEVEEAIKTVDYWYACGRQARAWSNPVFAIFSDGSRSFGVEANLDPWTQDADVVVNLKPMHEDFAHQLVSGD